MAYCDIRRFVDYFLVGYSYYASAINEAFVENNVMNAKINILTAKKWWGDLEGVCGVDTSVLMESLDKLYRLVEEGYEVASKEIPNIERNIQDWFIENIRKFI